MRVRPHYPAVATAGPVPGRRTVVQPTSTYAVGVYATGVHA